jgi:hypothetical protein
MSDKNNVWYLRSIHRDSSRSNDPEQKKGYEFVVKERGEAPGPYKILLQNPHFRQVLVPVGRYFQQSHSSLSDVEREIVVNLINAKCTRPIRITSTR